MYAYQRSLFVSLESFHEVEGELNCTRLLRTPTTNLRAFALMRQKVECDDGTEAVARDGEVAAVLRVPQHEQRMQPVHFTSHRVDDCLAVLGAGVEQDVDQSIVGVVAQLGYRAQRNFAQLLVQAGCLPVERIAQAMHAGKQEYL